MSHEFVLSQLSSLMTLHRKRGFYHRAEKTTNLAVLSWARREANQVGTAAKGSKLIKPSEENIRTAEIMLPDHVEARDHFRKGRKDIEKQMVGILIDLSLYLPNVYALVQHRGIAEGLLAQLLAEAGMGESRDGRGWRGIDRFEDYSDVWKRFGLALIDGERQRRVTDVDLALRHGYNPSRRSVAYQIGANLVMKKDDVYYPQYQAQKEKELAKGMKPVVADARARRWITKKFLRKLWVAYCADIRNLESRQEAA